MTNTNAKMTKKACFELLLTFDDVNDNPALVDFINNELDILSRKAENAKKESAEKAEKDAEIESLILSTMHKVGRPAQIKDLLKVNVDLLDIGSGKVQYLLNKMVKEGSANKTMEKRTAFFSAKEEG